MGTPGGMTRKAVRLFRSALPVFRWACAIVFFKSVAEIEGILKAARRRDHRDGKGRGSQQHLRLRKAEKQAVFGGRNAVTYAEGVRKIAC